MEGDSIVDRDVEILYSFLRLNQPLVKSDLLLVLGNDDIRTAIHAASVFLEGWAPLVLITGKEGCGTKGRWKRTEADVFADIMVSLGVPRESILLEQEATNTGENMKYSQKFLAKRDIEPESIIIATKSVMELRAALTFLKQWKNSESIRLTMTSPPLSLKEYYNDEIVPTDIADRIIMDTFEKLTKYANIGFQESVEIPAYAQQAYDNLVYRRQKL